MIQHLSPLDILAMGNCTRWHTVRTLREQTLADHSCRVALLAVWLGHQLGAGRFPAQYELDTLRLALVHDIPETQYGDVPAPTKGILAQAESLDFDNLVDGMFWEARGIVNPMAAASVIPLRLLKVADILDATTFYWTEGATLRRPGCDNLPLELVAQCWAMVDRELPELEAAVALVLDAAGVPSTLTQRIAGEASA